MHSTTKKLAVNANNFAAITVSVPGGARSMNDFGAIDVSVIGSILDRPGRPRFGG